MVEFDMTYYSNIVCKGRKRYEKKRDTYKKNEITHDNNIISTYNYTNPAITKMQYHENYYIR